MLVADPPFNVISPTSPYLAMWDTVQTKSSDRIYRGVAVCACVYVTVCIRKSATLADEVCVHTRRQCVCTCLRACAHARTKLGVTMDSKGAFEVF